MPERLVCCGNCVHLIHRFSTLVLVLFLSTNTAVNASSDVTDHDFAFNFPSIFKFVVTQLPIRCQQIFGRHSKSIDITKSGCGRCGGTLKLLPRLKVDGTPAKQRTVNGFAAYVKENFARVKSSLFNADHASVMKQLSAAYAATRSALVPAFDDE